MHGARVGKVAEAVALREPASLPGRVLALRHAGSALGSHARAAAQPERVIAYSKTVSVTWGAVEGRLRGARALSDVMRFDLEPLTRRMQPAVEAHSRLARGGGARVEAVRWVGGWVGGGWVGRRRRAPRLGRRRRQADRPHRRPTPTPFAPAAPGSTTSTSSCESGPWPHRRRPAPEAAGREAAEPARRRPETRG